jgi:hypothetical protein
MQPPVVLIGLGEMGGVFARGLLRIGHPVFPATRTTPLAEAAEVWPEPRAVLVAVGEKDLGAVLDAIPGAWSDRLILLQNELLPRDFRHLASPTVISVWFEKKPGREPKVIIPSPAFGPHSGLLDEALGSIGIPVRRLAGEDELLFELVVKNLYILTSNIAGLRVGGTVGTLWREHQDFARSVAADVIALQEAMTGRSFEDEALIQGMLRAFDGDPEHQCMGRSAPARLARAIEHGDRLGLAIPTLRDIAAQQRERKPG